MSSNIYLNLLFSGAWPVLIDEFVEYAKPLIGPKSTTVWDVLLFPDILYFFDEEDDMGNSLLWSQIPAWIMWKFLFYIVKHNTSCLPQYYGHAKNIKYSNYLTIYLVIYIDYGMMSLYMFYVNTSFKCYLWFIFWVVQVAAVNYCYMYLSLTLRYC